MPSPVTGVSLAAIVENMAEFRPEMCTEAAQQGLLQWLLKRLKVRREWYCHSHVWALGVTGARVLMEPGSPWPYGLVWEASGPLFVAYLPLPPF